MSVRVDGLSFAYDGTPVLRDVSLEVPAGEVLALVGPNGSGKTTLFRAVSGVIGGIEARRKVWIGERSLAEFSPRELARTVAAVEAEVETRFDYSVREVVELGRIPHLNRLQALGRRDHEVVDWALERTATRDLEERPLSRLSSGERQRVWIALALAQEPRLLVLDEPTSHLDLAFQVEALELVRRLAASGLTVLLSVHDLNLALRFADRVALLSRGRIAALGPPAEALTRERIEDAYGAAVRVLRDAAGRVEAILPERRDLGAR